MAAVSVWEGFKYVTVHTPNQAVCVPPEITWLYDMMHIGRFTQEIIVYVTSNVRGIDVRLIPFPRDIPWLSFGMHVAGIVFSVSDVICCGRGSIGD